IYDHPVRGASVYRLSTTASDAQSAAIAASENSADRFVTNPRFKTVSPAVAEILARLVSQETEVDSARLQKDMVGSLGQSVELLVDPGRHAIFLVLESASVPSVLVEMGFMSNRTDEALLRTPSHRNVITEAMERAIDADFVADSAVRLAG
ncbi:MAG: N-acetylmuramoyl-L-alanine amidase family protein, partial [Steroidobacteraceae bacterium]